MRTGKQILIAFNDSPASCNAINYCGQLFRNDADAVFQLVHCYASPAPSALPEPAANNDSLFPVNKKQINSKSAVLDKGIELLTASGIDRASIAASLIPTANETAQTIMVEARQKMVDAIFVARRGIGYLGEMVLGSVSATLFRKSHGVPLWIIDGEVSSRDVLIGVDGSVNALRAVDHIAYMFNNRNDITFYLYHCEVFLAPEVVCSLDQFYLHWDPQWCTAHLSGDGCLFNGPVQLLREAGIDPDRIVVLPVTKTLEESTSLVAQAKKLGCGAIVVGKRGPSVTKGFFGGVSNRTIRRTQDMAVCIVG